MSNYIYSDILKQVEEVVLMKADPVCSICHGKGVYYEYSTVETCPCSIPEKPSQMKENEELRSLAKRILKVILDDSRSPPPELTDSILADAKRLGLL